MMKLANDDHSLPIRLLNLNHDIEHLKIIEPQLYSFFFTRCALRCFFIDRIDDMNVLTTHSCESTGPETSIVVSEWSVPVLSSISSALCCLVFWDKPMLLYRTSQPS